MASVGVFYQLTFDFDPGLLPFRFSSTVNCTHAHTSQLNIVLFWGMSSGSGGISISLNKIKVFSWRAVSSQL
jgi:hypothetical protein